MKKNNYNKQLIKEAVFAGKALKIVLSQLPELKDYIERKLNECNR